MSEPETWETPEASAPTWETPIIRILIGDEEVATFENEVTAENILAVARERGIRRFTVFKIEDNQETALSRSDFPISAPATIKIVPLEKAGA